jgi:hypothetical protein
LFNVASFWIYEYIEILLGAHPIFHISRIRLNVDRPDLRNLNELEVKKQYQVKISRRCAGFESLNGIEGINRAWENMKENI